MIGRLEGSALRVGDYDISEEGDSFDTGVAIACVELIAVW